MLEPRKEGKIQNRSQQATDAGRARDPERAWCVPNLGQPRPGLAVHSGARRQTRRSGPFETDKPTRVHGATVLAGPRPLAGEPSPTQRWCPHRGQNVQILDTAADVHAASEWFLHRKGPVEPFAEVLRDSPLWHAACNIFPWQKTCWKAGRHAARLLATKP